MTRKRRKDVVRSIRRTGDNSFDVMLPAEDRRVLGSLATQMREFLADGDCGDPARDRLFPIAYPTDDDRQTEYRLLVHGELEESHLGALAVLEESSGAGTLDEDQLMAWMRSINQVRLVLGSRLDISEDGAERPASFDDPAAASFGVYDYLTWLQDEIVEALASEFDSESESESESD